MATTAKETTSKERDNEMLRRLAEFEPSSDMPVLSVYLDMRPHANGENPGRRMGETVLRDRLKEIEKTYGPRGDQFESFQADRERIEKFIEEEMSESAQGIMIFACSAAELWETAEVGIELDNEVLVGDRPALFQFVKMLDEHDTTVVAVVDSNTARFFVTRSGKLQEYTGPDDPNVKMYSKSSVGGWKQMKYQRNIDNNKDDFSEVIAEQLEKLVKKVDARAIIVAGDEASTTRLTDSVTPEIKELLQDEVLRIDIKATRNEVKEEIADILNRIEEEIGNTAADQLVGAVRGGGLGIAGVSATRQALENGQVETLLLDPDSTNLTEETREELIRLAATTSADVEIVQDHPVFSKMDGVGGILRYKIDRQPNSELEQQP